MSCNCPAPNKSSLWTNIPDFQQPTEILPGENVDCYAARAGNVSGLQDDARQAPPAKILTPSIVAKSTGEISVQMEASDSDPATEHPRPYTWEATGLPPGISITPSGNISGTIPDAEEGKTFKILVKAKDSAATEFDSREYTVVFKKAGPVSDGISLVTPYIAASGSPRVSSQFGPRIHPIQKTQKNHNGLDYVAASGAAKGKGKIVAAADGEVTFAGNAGGYGLLVKINHLNSSGKLLCETRYAHCSQLLVSRGQQVAQGQVVALEGSTGGSTGPHLHFELRLGGTTPADPIPFITGQMEIQPPQNPDGSEPAPVTVSNSQNRQEVANITPELVSARSSGCPTTLPNTDPVTQLITELPPPEDLDAYNQIIQAIAYANINDPELVLKPLDLKDKDLLLFMAKIESNYIPTAKNPTSSALGVFQMLDKTANHYFAKAKIAPSFENRTNAYLATLAQIEFYKDQRSYYDQFQSSQTIANKSLTPALIAKYTPYTKGEFIYGLVHHDGIGNAVKGVDKQGVDYYRKKVKQFTA